jgi:Domain of unknown function (DUF397)
MSTSLGTAHAKWVKSSYSGNGGDNCLEWAPEFAASGVIPVRDSKDPHRPPLVFPADGWTSFTSALRNGELTA